MIRSAARLAGLAAALFLCGSAAAQDDSKLRVKEGDKFPNVPLKAAQIEKLPGKKAGDTVSIADLKGKNVVVFFYPRALTSGCTIESCGFRDIYKEFPENTVVLGASNDDVPLNQKFIDKEMLPYPLMCDTDAKLIKELGILSPKGNAAQRVTFVIDKEGKIAKIFPAGSVDVKTHPKMVLEFVKTLK
jgi:peroxiredoxin Q/BCP